MLSRTEIRKLFNEYINYEFYAFEKINNPLCAIRDVCGFLKLMQLFPNKKRDLIAAAEHDILYLDVSLEDLELNDNLTEEDILYLRRCNITLDSSADCLAMSK